MQWLRHKVSQLNDISLRECQAFPALQQLKKSTKCWIITDGKAGDEKPCIGVAETLGLSYTILHVNPRPFYAALAPFFADPQENILTIQKDMPDMIIASGRRAVPVMRAIKRKAPHVFCVFLKNPRIANSGADFIWQPAHDHSFQQGAYVSLLSPHHINLLQSRKCDEHKTIGVLVGGDSRHTRWTAQDIAEFTAVLRSYMAMPNVRLNITTSRRTPEALKIALQTICTAPHRVWSPSSDEPNPYIDILSKADALLVTADSINMLSEALTSGAPVYIFEPNTKAGRIRTHIARLMAEEIVKPATSSLQFEMGEGYNVTPALAHHIAQAYLKFKGHIE